MASLLAVVSTVLPDPAASGGGAGGDTSGRDEDSKHREQ